MTCDVGRYQPNAWGLYDINGLMWEYCRIGEVAPKADAKDSPKGDAKDSPKGDAKDSPKGKDEGGRKGK